MRLNSNSMGADCLPLIRDVKVFRYLGTSFAFITPIFVKCLSTISSSEKPVSFV